MQTHEPDSVCFTYLRISPTVACRLQECHIEMSEAQLNGLLEKEGVTPDRKLGVPIMHAETFKRIMLHVRPPLSRH